MNRAVATLSILLSFGALVSIHAAAPIPLAAEELFRAPAFSFPRISADGSHCAAIASDEDDFRHLLVIDLKNRTRSSIGTADDGDIVRFCWLGNEAILFSATEDKIYSAGLHVVYLDTPERTYALRPRDDFFVVATPTTEPGHALVWLKQFAPTPPTLFGLSTYEQLSGKPFATSQPPAGGLVEFDASRIAGKNTALRHDTFIRRFSSPPSGVVTAWLAHANDGLPLCVVWRDGRLRLYRYLPAGDAWKEYLLALGQFTPLALDADDHFLWLVTHDTETGFELRRTNLDTGDLDRAVLTDPLYDIGQGQLVFSRRTHALAGVTYHRRHRISRWIAPEFAAAQTTIDRTYPATHNVLVDHDDAERKFLFVLTGPRQPPVYVLLDLDRQSSDQIAPSAPWLAGKTFSPVYPVNFRARDGVMLEGYLTIPAGVDQQHPGPLVVLPHGGPWDRDTADFNPEVQFLASRGYLVFQPNYRGSSGYTPEISDSHDYNFRRMHDDVTDGAKAMLRSGLVDPHRVAIMGASFGGYLALAGVAFEDDLYRCAISQCGVFDWERHANSKRDSGDVFAYERLTANLGQPGRNKESFEAISPLAHVDRIKVPVLIAHGTKDNVVDFVQSRKLADALAARGIPHETFFRKLEGHGFYNYRNRVDFYHRVEAFLAVNLGGATLTTSK